MNENKRTLLLVVITLMLATAAFVFSILSYHHSTSVVYVDLLRLHEGFELKKELGREIDNAKLTRSHSLDSLKLDYQIAERRHASKEELSEKAQVYRYKEQQMEKDFDDLAHNYEERIWRQLNLYAMKYGEAQHYDIILGMSGNGSIMYGVKGKEITDELLIYSNKMYNGKQDK